MRPCPNCPFWYTDSGDEDCPSCHYDGLEIYSPCAEYESEIEEEYIDDYEWEEDEE